MKNLIEKIYSGDVLTNTELLNLHVKLSELSNLLTGLGKDFHFFRSELYRSTDLLQGYITARELATLPKAEHFFKEVKKALATSSVDLNIRTKTIEFLELIISYADQLGERYEPLSVYCQSIIIRHLLHLNKVNYYER